jgi:hypothetical protein
LPDGGKQAQLIAEKLNRFKLVHLRDAHLWGCSPEPLATATTQTAAAPASMRTRLHSKTVAPFIIRIRDHSMEATFRTLPGL